MVVCSWRGAHGVLMGFGGENAASAHPAPVGVLLAFPAAVVGFCVVMLNHLIRHASCAGSGAKSSIKCNSVALFGNAGFGGLASRERQLRNTHESAKEGTNMSASGRCRSSANVFNRARSLAAGAAGT